MTLVRQLFDWDCGPCCMAMALGISREEAMEMLPRLRRDRGWYPGEIAKAIGSKVLRGARYKGSLERCILQVSVRDRHMASHYVWSDNGLHDPADALGGWAMIRVDYVIPVEERQ